MACALPSVSTFGLPWYALPIGWHDVLALVATERDPEHGVVSVGDGPFADVVSDRQGIFSIEVGVSLCCVCIRRVKKNAGHPIVKGWRRSHNSVPIATANADVAHSVAQLGETAHVGLPALSRYRITGRWIVCCSVISVSSLAGLRCNRMTRLETPQRPLVESHRTGHGQRHGALDRIRIPDSNWVQVCEALLDSRICLE